MELVVPGNHWAQMIITKCVIWQLLPVDNGTKVHIEIFGVNFPTVILWKKIIFNVVCRLNCVQKGNSWAFGRLHLISIGNCGFHRQLYSQSGPSWQVVEINQMANQCCCRLSSRGDAFGTNKMAAPINSTESSASTIAFMQINEYKW